MISARALAGVLSLGLVAASEVVPARGAAFVLSGTALASLPIPATRHAELCKLVTSKKWQATAIALRAGVLVQGGKLTLHESVA